MIKIKNTFVLILLIVNICHAQNDIFDIKTKKDFIITDNPKHFVGSGVLHYMGMEGDLNDMVMHGKKDLKYSFGFSWSTLPGPMINSKKIVEIYKSGTRKKMIIYTGTLRATVPFYYFKNLKFKEGKYDIYELYTCNKYKVKGNEIDVSERTKNILFKNIKVNNKYKDLRFKDIEFTVIDFKEN